MKQPIAELARIYLKILNGEATDSERLKYEITIRTSCMAEEYLIAKIKDEASKLK